MKKPDFSKPKELKAAFISVYRTQCGISTYSEWLWPRMGALFKDYRVFAEVAPSAPAEPNVVRCWKRGESLSQLTRELKQYEPDVIYIQHEYGIFPNARFWLAMLSALSQYRVVVCFHSVYNHEDKSICEAAVKEIVVHTQPAHDLLRQKGISGKITVVPHGCLPNAREKRPWNLYQTEHTLMQFGFGFRYKGWERALETVAILKEEFPDVMFTGLFSTPAHCRAEMDDYFEELQEKVEKLGLQDNVALIKGFQEESILRNFIRMSRVALFPYIPNGEHTVMGCSGAARFTMSQGIPVVTSGVPLFADIAGVVPQQDSPEAMALEISALFRSKEHAAKQVQRQDAFLLDNSWDRSAQRYVDALKS